MQIETFCIHRQNIHKTQWASEHFPSIDNLQNDEVLLKIEKYAFTANNISYITTGDKLGYWQFFPSQQADWGKVPVWGFATVEASAHERVAVGERFYGYFPMASHLLVQAGKVKTHGFFDVMPHRANLPAIYNQYLNVQQDELYEAGKEAFQAIFRPLFTTSFLLEAFMVSHDFFGATQIVLTSASSKTAFALASLLKAYQKTSANPFKIVGLTSTNNEPFVAGLGCYDTLITYSNLPTLPQEKTVVIDFAGNQTLHYDLQAHIGDNLTYNCLVGAVHWDKGTADKMPPNKGKFFFAPTHAEQFLQTWGRDVFQKRLSEAWHSFATQASDWIHIEIAQDKNRLSEVYQTLLAGKYPAKNGFIFAH